MKPRPDGYTDTLAPEIRMGRFIVRTKTPVRCCTKARFGMRIANARQGSRIEPVYGDAANEDGPAHPLDSNESIRSFPGCGVTSSSSATIRPRTASSWRVMRRTTTTIN